MIPVSVETIIVGGPVDPSVLVIRPEMDSPYGKYVLPIWVGPHEALALVSAIEGVRPSRPMTHDLLLDTIKKLGAEIIAVKITKVKGTTFYAEIVLAPSNGSALKIDARPSDAIALAIASKARILANPNVIETAGFPMLFNSKSAEDNVQIEAFHQFIETVNPQDFVAHCANQKNAD